MNNVIDNENSSLIMPIFLIFLAKIDFMLIKGARVCEIIFLHFK